MSLSLEQVHESLMRALHESTDKLLSRIERNTKSLQAVEEKLQSMLDFKTEWKEAVQMVKRDTAIQEIRLKVAEGEAETRHWDAVSDVEGSSKQEWASNLEGVDQNTAALPFNQESPAQSQNGLKVGSAGSVSAREEVAEGKERQCFPYPFGKYDSPDWYIDGDILNVAESGGSLLIEPCHEFKGFTKTTEETKLIKFEKDLIMFAAACMNSRTNGTIHFGVANNPHGKILGVLVKTNEKEQYDKHLHSVIPKHFNFKHIDIVKKCIKPTRFVEVRNRNLTPSGKFVIEVDIVPHYVICESELFHTHNRDTKEDMFYVRDGSSNTNLKASTTSDKKSRGYHKFLEGIDKLAKSRKQAEEMEKGKKSHNQGFQLRHLITRATGSLDKSNYKKFFIVIKKSHPNQLESLRFLLHLRPATIYDFDQQSAENGLYHYFNDEFSECKSTKESVSLIHGSDASVENVERLCEKIHKNKRYIFIFLVLSKVTDEMDPLFVTFRLFHQKLRDTKQILCICVNKNVFVSWKKMIKVSCDVDISNRCIYELSLAEVNGTILSLLPENRRSIRFLPGVGGSKVVFEKELEHQLTTLDVLCVNQCEGIIEQNYGRQSRWDRFVSTQLGSMAVLQTYDFANAVDTLISGSRSWRKVCVWLNPLHVPGFEASTLANYILWTLRGNFRCAVLNDHKADLAKVAEHIVTLLKCGSAEQKPPVPVLLMIVDFKNMEEVRSLKELIKAQCMKNNILFRPSLVIIINCMRKKPMCEALDSHENTMIISRHSKI